MLNLFQHLVCFFLLSADASFIPVHRKGFSDAILINNEEMSISVISSMELIIGCRDKVDLQKTQKFLSEFEIIDISIPISRKAYQLIIQYSKSHGLVIPDAFIVGTALEENLKLVTSNVRHFEMISGVTIQKPY